MNTLQLTEELGREAEYAVQWKTVSQPRRWSFYSRYYSHFGKAKDAYAKAIACSTCTAARIIQRDQIYTDVTRKRG